MGAGAWVALIIALVVIAVIAYEIKGYQQAKDAQPPGIWTPFGGITL